MNWEDGHYTGFAFFVSLPSNGIVIANSALSGWTNRRSRSLTPVFRTMPFNFLQ